MVRRINCLTEAPKYPRGIRKEDSYRQYGLYYEDVARFFKRKGYDISNDEVFNYISGVVDLMDYDPELGSGEVLPSEWLSDWYMNTKRNYPEDIEWLESTRK